MPTPRAGLRNFGPLRTFKNDNGDLYHFSSFLQWGRGPVCTCVQCVIYNQALSTPPLRASHILRNGTVQVNNYNFAFCGPVKSGKSRLINSIRGVESNKPGGPVKSGVAEIGEFETTTKMKKYYFYDPQLIHAVLWDVPGSGTIGEPSSRYF
jgi:hypothetical protein